MKKKLNKVAKDTNLFLKKFRSSNNYVNIKNENYLTDVINKKKHKFIVHYLRIEVRYKR